MTAPYYDDGSCVIYHGDCREMFPVWDLAGAVMVTDPPYGMGFSSNMAGSWKRRSLNHPGRVQVKPVRNDVEGDQSVEIRDEILGFWLPRPSLVFGTWKCDRPAAFRHLLVWDKGNCPGAGDLSLPWGSSHEEIYVFGVGFTGRRGADVLRHQLVNSQDSSRPAHPTPKPLGLMRALIEKCPPLAEVVDPFMGSGTTLRAAKDLGRKSIGIEIEERYCEIAAKRLAQEVLAL